MLSAGTMLSRILRDSYLGMFLTATKRLSRRRKSCWKTKYSVNFPVKYILRDKERRGWINFINLFLALLVQGSPGSGKSYFIILHVITQHIHKGFVIFVYDFKMPDLAVITDNTWLKFKDNYKVPPKFSL